MLKKFFKYLNKKLNMDYKTLFKEELQTDFKNMLKNDIKKI